MLFVYNELIFTPIFCSFGKENKWLGVATLVKSCSIQKLIMRFYQRWIHCLVHSTPSHQKAPVKPSKTAVPIHNSYEFTNKPVHKRSYKLVFA